MERDPSLLMSSPGGFYMQRGFSELHEQQGVPSLPNSGMAYQLNFTGRDSGQGLMVESTSNMLSDNSHGVEGSMQPSPTPMRRKRGRPRKYGVDAKMSLDRSSVSVTPRVINTSSEKRGRGRPPGSGRKQPLFPFGKLVSGSAGGGFTPHVISVATGEDISSKLIAFAKQGRRSVCILSANGAVSRVTLGQPSSSGGTITYEGHYDILCMSGSFLLLENDGSREKSGSMSITLAGSDGRVIGGTVGGMLIAASPVQVIVGSFMWTTPKTNPKDSEANESGKDLEQYAVNNTTTMGQTDGQRSQNLSSPTSLMGAWGCPQSLDGASKAKTEVSSENCPGAPQDPDKLEISNNTRI